LISIPLSGIDNPPAEKQSSPPRSVLWVDGGGGINLLGWSAGLSLSLPLDGRVISFRMLSNSQVKISTSDYIGLNEIIDFIAIFPMIQLADAFGASSTAISEYGLLYGKYWDGARTHASLSGGLSYVKGKYMPFHEMDGFSRSFSTMGLPLEVKLFYHPRSSFEFGYYFFGNINQDRSYAGFMLNFRIGRTR